MRLEHRLHRAFFAPRAARDGPKALKVTGIESSCPTAASGRHRATKAGTRMRLTASLI